MTSQLIKDYIMVNSLLVVSTVFTVTALDKALGKKISIVNSNRGWVLPITSLVMGTFIYYIFASSSGLQTDINSVMFHGLNTGAFSTVCYKVVKEAFLERINKHIKEL